MRKPRPTKPSIRNLLTNAWLYIAGFAVIVTVIFWIGVLCLLFAKWLHN